MTIILTGGGSGGHITPVLAVANQLKKNQPDIHLIYIGQRGDSLSDIPAKHPAIDAVYTVRAGKFRRYHKAGWRQLLDVMTMLKNTRDFFLVFIGIIQSWRLLKKLRPDAIFIRGGFVGVPVGLAAGWRHIPYITHDSDAVPSLANRIISKKAAVHAVAMPKGTYPYPQDKTFQVGVPIDSGYQPVTPQLKHKYREQLGINTKAPTILVTGGGLGAQRLNEAIVGIMPVLFDRYPDLVLLHITGRMHEASIKEHYRHMLGAERYNQVIVKGFIDDFYLYSGSADVIVCRAGATNLAEFARQHKACVVVPNPQLTGGHQVKNSQELSKASAIILVTEDQISPDPQPLLNAVTAIIDNPEKRQSLENNLALFSRPHATEDLARLIIDVANKKTKVYDRI